MPTQLPSAISASYIPSKTVSSQPDFSQLVPVVLFSGMGLLVSLVAILSGMQGAWF